MSRVRSIIEDRFRILYKIDLGDHIKRVIKMGATTGEGFSFEPVDHKMFRLALQKTKKFFPDNGPYSHGDAIGIIAASATNGEGWREEGLLSLHCAIAPEVCSVHLDGVGFVLEGRRGKYGPDVINHIAHDLGWWTIVNAAYRQSSLLGDVLSRIHPHVLSGKNPDLLSFTSPYRNVGISADLIDVKNSIGADRYKLTIDFSESCTGPRLCSKHGPVLSIDFTARVDWDRYLVGKK